MQSNFNLYQIVSILKEHEEGKSTKDLFAEYGVPVTTIYTWKQRYSEVDVQILQDYKAILDDNDRLKRMYAELSLAYCKLKEIIAVEF